MAETVNIPSLGTRVKWGRRSDTAAHRRNCALKSVGVDARRQIHALSRP